MELTKELREILEKQLSAEYNGLIQQAFNERDSFKSSMDRLSTLNIEADSKITHLRVEITGLKETIAKQDSEVKELNKTLATLTAQNAQFTELKLRAEFAETRVNDNKEMMRTVFGTPYVQHKIHGQKAVRTTTHDGKPEDLLLPVTETHTEIKGVGAAPPAVDDFGNPIS